MFIYENNIKVITMAKEEKFDFQKAMRDLLDNSKEICKDITIDDTLDEQENYFREMIEKYYVELNEIKKKIKMSEEQVKIIQDMRSLIKSNKKE